MTVCRLFRVWLRNLRGEDALAAPDEPEPVAWMSCCVAGCECGTTPVGGGQ